MCKKLQAAGWPQTESHFYWKVCASRGQYGADRLCCTRHWSRSIDPIAAPTAEELLTRMILPEKHAAFVRYMEQEDSLANACAFVFCSRTK